jgi:hypothetical protein
MRKDPVRTNDRRQIEAEARQPTPLAELNHTRESGLRIDRVPIALTSSELAIRPSARQSAIAFDWGIAPHSDREDRSAVAVVARLVIGS